MSATSRRKRPPLTVEALWQLQRVGPPTLAPDGSAACCAVTRYAMRRNEGETSLWLFPTGLAGPRGAKPRKLTAGDKDSDPVWSPDGRRIAFAAKRKDDAEPQLYVIAPDGGEARRVTRLATGVSGLKWFPDGRRIAFVSWVWPDLAGDAQQARRRKERAEAKVKAHVTERGEYRYWDHWLADGREPHLFVCDVASGRCRDVFAGRGLRLRPWEPNADEYDIAPDGREVAITFDPGDEPRMMARADLVVLDLPSGRWRNVTADSGMSDEHPRYSPDGRRIAYHAYDTQRAFNDQGHLRVLDRRSGAWSRLAPALDRATTHVQWAPDSQALLFCCEDAGRIDLRRLPLGAEAPEVLVRGGTLGGFACSRDASVIAFDRATPQHPPRLFAARGDGSDERAIERLNDALLARHALGETREFAVPGWKGEPVQVFVTYPPGFDPSRKWPLMHSIHGGPHAAHHDGWHFRWNAQVFAGTGRIVAAVNYHGSSGFGQAFLESITGRYGEKELADHEAATDFLLAQGYVDGERLTAAGGSYGGFMVAFMNGHVDRYRAFVCHAGCYDWVSMMATDGYRFFASELGAWHWDDPARVMRQSPHHHVGNAKTPTLVIHGELDYRVPATQALQYYDTLKARDVPARLVWFPDENHWILKPQNARLWYGEFLAWLDRWSGAQAAMAPPDRPAPRRARREARGVVPAKARER
ncbi:MAG: S9 family peptidase [Burkholderiales bacterium]|nr:S9 family peptidase [Burkholderiales bacterium]